MTNAKLQTTYAEENNWKTITQIEKKWEGGFVTNYLKLKISFIEKYRFYSKIAKRNKDDEQENILTINHLKERYFSFPRTNITDVINLLFIFNVKRKILIILSCILQSSHILLMSLFMDRIIIIIFPLICFHNSY